MAAHSLSFAALEALYLFSPLILASAISGVVLRWDLLPRFRRPVDGGRSFRGHRLFGDSKTWRGFIVAIVGCILGVALQKDVLTTDLASISLVRYDELNVLGFGTAMGAGAMLGELPNSFVKRQLGITPGGTTSGPLAVLFYVWDQVDLLLGAWPLIALWVVPPWRVVLMSFAVVLTLHPLISLIGFLIGARKTAR